MKSDLDLLLNDSFFKKSQISFCAYDLTAKDIIYRKDEKLLLHPASNMKVITSAAGLVFLGTDYNFSTSIALTGDIVDSTLNGDIIFIGKGDPDFSYSDLDSLIREIKTLGINRITGNLIGNISYLDSTYWGKGWMWDDDPYTDFPYMSPLLINDAALDIIVSPSETGNIADIKFFPDNDYVSISNRVTTIDSGRTNIRISRDWQKKENNYSVEGEILTSSEPDTSKVTVIRSAEYFLACAQACFIENGIAFDGNRVITSDSLTQKIVFSKKRSFGEVIVNLNKTSDNLSAEMTLRALGSILKPNMISATDGVQLIDSLVTLSGLDPHNYRIVDGSGVSHYNLVTSELLLEILKYIYLEQEDLFPILKNSFPVGGIDGTLKYRMNSENTKNNVHAKTGTLSGVSTLSGYLTSKNGHEIAFSVFVQNYMGSSKKARTIQDKICEILSKI